MKIGKNLDSNNLLKQEKLLVFSNFGVEESLILGESARNLGILGKLPIAIEISINNWVTFHISLPGSTKENNLWILRKSNVVYLKCHSTLYEQTISKEKRIDWFQVNKVSRDDHAIEGGGLPLITLNGGFVGALVISGLSQIEDHLFGVEVLSKSKMLLN
jgi:uncharacterized protein (UPF0303 family)